MNRNHNGGELVGLLNRRRMMHLCSATLASSIINCSRRDDDSALETLQVSASPMLSVSSLHLAQESGYFSDVGLKLNIQQLPEPGYAPVLLAGGKIDIGFTAISPTVINAIIEGARLKLVAAREIVSTSCGDFGAVYGTRETFPKGVDLRMLAGKRISRALDRRPWCIRLGYSTGQRGFINWRCETGTITLLRGHGRSTRWPCRLCCQPRPARPLLSCSGATSSWSWHGRILTWISDILYSFWAEAA